MWFRHNIDWQKSQVGHERSLLFNIMLKHCSALKKKNLKLSSEIISSHFDSWPVCLTLYNHSHTCMHVLRVFKCIKFDSFLSCSLHTWFHEIQILNYENAHEKFNQSDRIQFICCCFCLIIPTYWFKNSWHFRIRDWEFVKLRSEQHVCVCVSEVYHFVNLAVHEICIIHQ
jgi:hypothetical protein